MTNITEKEIERLKKVEKWFHENSHFFNLEQCLGLDIQCSLYNLVKECSYDGEETASTGQVVSKWTAR